VYVGSTDTADRIVDLTDAANEAIVDAKDTRDEADDGGLDRQDICKRLY
jgi:hypothetical protein